MFITSTLPKYDQFIRKLDMRIGGPNCQSTLVEEKPCPALAKDQTPTLQSVASHNTVKFIPTKR